MRYAGVNLSAMKGILYGGCTLIGSRLWFFPRKNEKFPQKKKIYSVKRGCHFLINSEKQIPENIKISAEIKKYSVKSGRLFRIKYKKKSTKKYEIAPEICKVFCFLQKFYHFRRTKNFSHLFLRICYFNWTKTGNKIEFMKIYD